MPGEDEIRNPILPEKEEDEPPGKEGQKQELISLAEKVKIYDQQRLKDSILGLLNEALSIDPIAANELFHKKVSCNQAMRDHPTIVVGERDGKYTLGILGLINGFTGNICAVYDEDDAELKTILRFDYVRPSKKQEV